MHRMRAWGTCPNREDPVLTRGVAGTPRWLRLNHRPCATERPYLNHQPRFDVPKSLYALHLKNRVMQTVRKVPLAPLSDLHRNAPALLSVLLDQAQHSLPFEPLPGLRPKPSYQGGPSSRTNSLSRLRGEVVPPWSPCRPHPRCPPIGCSKTMTRPDAPFLLRPFAPAPDQ